MFTVLITITSVAFYIIMRKIHLAEFVHLKRQSTQRVFLTDICVVKRSPEKRNSQVEYRDVKNLLEHSNKVFVFAFSLDRPELNFFLI